MPVGEARERGSLAPDRAYLERPGTAQEMALKWAAFSARLRRAPESDRTSAQLAVLDEVAEDLAAVTGTQPCGICAASSRRLCHHPLAKTVWGFVLVTLAGYRVTLSLQRLRRGRKPTPGQLALWDP